MNKKNIAFTGGSLFSPNRGVGAITYGSLKAIANAFPEDNIFLIEYSKEEKNFTFLHNKNKYDIKPIAMRFSKKIYLRNNIILLLIGAFIIRILPLKPIKNLLYFFLPNLKKLDQISIIYSISGGDSFSDIYGISLLIYITLPELLFSILRKRVIFLPQTIGPFNTFLGRVIAKRILSNTEKIYTRDIESQIKIKQMFKSHNIIQKTTFCYDVGFLLDPQKPKNINLKALDNKKNVYCGLNISGLLYSGGYTQKNQFNLKVDYKKITQKIISYFLNKNKYVKIILIPHVFGAQLESDYTICKTIYTNLNEIEKKRILFFDDTFNVQEIKHLIGLCDFFIGSRMHACIAAISQCIPTVPIAYSRKFKGVMKSIGMEDFVADPRYDDLEEIIAVIDSAFEKEKEINNLLKTKIPLVKKEILDVLKI